jgi:predicted CoA-binding protein
MMVLSRYIRNLTAVLIASETVMNGPHRRGDQTAHVPKYLLERGYEIIPVNSTTDVILGLRVYKIL